MTDAPGGIPPGPPPEGAHAHAQQAPQPQHHGAPAPAPRGLPTRAIVAIAVGGVMILALIVLLVLQLSSGSTPGPADGTEPAPAGSEPAEDPGDVVEGYLSALSQSDAEAAGAYLTPMFGDLLLTSEVLAASNEIAPITDIVVGEAEQVSSLFHRVDVSFRIGDTLVERTFEVARDGTLIDGTVPWILPPTTFGDLGLTVNGQEIPPEGADLFPGAYRLDVEAEPFRAGVIDDAGFPVPLDDVVVLTGEFVDLPGLQPILTEEAEETFRALVRESLEECLDSRALTTPCGLDVDNLSSVEAIDGTVERTLTAEGEAALDALTSYVEYESPGVVSTIDYIKVDVLLEADADGRRVEVDPIGIHLHMPSVDFTAPEPSVSWGR